MTAQEFGEWMAYYAMHPFGSSGDWFRSGVIASTIANVNRAPNTEPFSAADFMPRKREDKPAEVENPVDFFKAE